MTSAVEQAPKLAGREKWLRERKTGIGASDAAGILGLNPDSSAFETWAEKTGRIEGPEESLAMWLGHEMEPIIAKRYEMETGRILHNPGDYENLRHPDYDWLRCTRDRTAVLSNGERGPVELKAPGARQADKWSATESPLGYQVQLQIQMACMGASMGEIAALVGNSDFYVIPYERNDEFLDAIIPVLYEFWQCVQNDTPPEIDGTEATASALKRLHPLDNGESVEIGNAAAAAWHELQELKAMMKETEKEIKLRENVVRAALGDNTYGEHCGVRLFSHKAQTRKGALKVPAGYRDDLLNVGIPFDETKPCTFRVLRKVGK